MSADEVVIVQTSTANLASVCAAVRRMGAEPVIASDPAAAQEAGFVIVPGVGAFGAGSAALERAGLTAVLRERIDRRRPTLGICLGFQLFCTDSDESPGVAGIGSIAGRLESFPAGARSPQFGWNRVNADEGTSVLGDGYAYFANSYRLAQRPEGWRVAWSDHHGSFVAALENVEGAGMPAGSVVGCQFHPELSGEYGAALLKRWWSRSREAVAC